VIVTKSTVPIGTGDEVERIVRETAPDKPTWVVSNPEFLREGAAIEDFKHPDRIVIGAEEEPAREVMREIYRPLYLNKAPLLFTSRRTAELIKYAANAFLATKITFINEMRTCAKMVGADVQDVSSVSVSIAASAPVPPSRPDMAAPASEGHAGVAETAEDYHAPLRTSGRSSSKRCAQAGDGAQVIRAGASRGARRCAARPTFKPNTDDMRDAPSISIVQALEDAGVKVRAYDPEGMEQARPLMPKVELCHTPYEAAENAHAVVLVTEWDVLRALDMKRLARTMADPVLIDLRNIYPPEEVAAAGLKWQGVGRPAVDPT
jgi:UDPglucose 6-dehydrogenase